MGLFSIFLFWPHRSDARPGPGHMPPREIDVTFDATASQSHAQPHSDPTLIPALAITAVAAATLAGAWFFQLVLDILPCELCLEQRYAYYLAIPLAALTALAGGGEASRAGV